MVSAGTISSSDQSALSTALNNIDSDLQSDVSVFYIAPLADRYKIEDRQLDRAGSAKRRADKRSGDRAAERFFERVFSRAAPAAPAVTHRAAARAALVVLRAGLLPAAAQEAQAAPARPAVPTAPRSSSFCWPARAAARAAPVRAAAPRPPVTCHLPAPRRTQAVRQTPRRIPTCSTSFCRCCSNRSAPRPVTTPAEKPTARSRLWR